MTACKIEIWLVISVSSISMRVSVKRKTTLSSIGDNLGQRNLRMKVSMDLVWGWDLGISQFANTARRCTPCTCASNCNSFQKFEAADTVEPLYFSSSQHIISRIKVSPPYKSLFITSKDDGVDSIQSQFNDGTNFLLESSHTASNT